MAKFDDDQFMPFQLDHVSVERFGHHQILWNLARKSRLPGSVEELRGSIQAHHLNRLGRCDRFGVGEAFEKRAYAEPMISMTMR
jgi:hypothetical protein